MTDDRADLQQQYAAALREHLRGSGEAALHRAYELGRAALNQGIGLLDLSLLHHEVLREAGDGRPSAAELRRIAKAAEFFAESLSPFEMSLSGYREANDRLNALNRSLQQAKAEVEAANRELEAFSYSVAHDLRAPLRSIDGFSQALLEDYLDKLDAEGRQNLHYVRESAQQMAELIDDLLALARVTRSELKRERFDLSALAALVVGQLRTRDPRRQVEVAIAEGLDVEADPRLLRAALENLLGNAWKFTGKRADARIEFGAIPADGEMAYFVRDNGAGFDMAYAGKLFGVFQRLHSAGEFEGTGIGLATVQRIVRRHGGRIWAEGEVGRGATFFFTLEPGRNEAANGTQL
jgi:light-regulated signal transduction histidine kinase (bacteriophytochrome)